MAFASDSHLGDSRGSSVRQRRTSFFKLRGKLGERPRRGSLHQGREENTLFQRWLRATDWKLDSISEISPILLTAQTVPKYRRYQSNVQVFTRMALPLSQFEFEILPAFKREDKRKAKAKIRVFWKKKEREKKTTAGRSREGEEQMVEPRTCSEFQHFFASKPAPHKVVECSKMFQIAFHIYYAISPYHVCNSAPYSTECMHGFKGIK